MKKILITGMTRKQCFSEENLPESTKKAWNHIQYASTPCLVEKAFKMLGHNVDRRPVKLGEDLDGYDIVIVYLSGMCTRFSMYLFGALWAIHQRPDAIWSIDDWRIADLRRNASIAKRGDQWNLGISKTEYTLAREQYRSVIDETVAKVAYSEPWPRTLVPMFPWGDYRKLGLPLKQVLPFDPTSIAGDLSSLIGYERLADGRRRREWISASLGNVKDRDRFINRLRLDWPVTIYGGRMKIQRIDEAQLVREYIRAWGNLVIPYPHVGSGWYRTRFLHSAHFRSILVCDPRDAAPMGEAFQFAASNARAIEQMSDSDLEYIAEGQANWFFENVWSQDQLLGTFDTVANAAPLASASASEASQPNPPFPY